MNVVPRKAPSAVPTGCIKSFGPFGPKYAVGRLLRHADGGEEDWLIEVTMVDSGELVEYPLSKLLDDPHAP